jgi:CubicO group peptidase (beta-lactamase class C family)
MRVLGLLVKWLVILVLAAVVILAGWLWFAPPDLIRVGTGYAAKIVCSNVFIAGRDAQDVLKVDVQAPGHPLLTLVSVDVDRDAKTVTASLLGLFGSSTALARDGLGCASVPDGNLAAVPASPLPALAPTAPSDGLWPEGGRVEPSQEPSLAAILDDPKLAGPGMRAIVVVHNGRIVGERYGAGFSAETPLLGWSMSKTVNAAIIGTIIREGQLDLNDVELFEEWDSDPRNGISLSDLMAMSSGLEFNEDYGDVTDVTRMLYLEKNMGAFASEKPLAYPAGSTFNYSSGTAVMLSYLWQNRFDDPAVALAWPRKELFGPLGMASTVMETDASGTFVGSSYIYATARDWARFGQFMLQGGVWNGRPLLPEGFVAWMTEEAPASKGEYGRGQLWLHGPQAGTPAGQDPDAGFGLPNDAYWLLGHDGQTTTVIPSRNLVVVRLGLTPSKLAYKPQALVAAIATALP